MDQPEKDTAAPAHTPDADSAGEHTVHLFSLRMEAPQHEPAAPTDLEKVLLLIQKEALRILHIEENEINALFQNPASCLETAVEVTRLCAEHALALPQRSDAPKIGLHSTDERTFSQKGLHELFEQPLLARKLAAPGEVVMTGDFYRHLPEELRKLCSEKKAESAVPGTLYVVCGTCREDDIPVLVSAMTDRVIHPGVAPCFYCGVTTHTTSLCPSKLIQHSTRCLEKIGYMPLVQLQHVFQKHFSEIVQPLQSASEEDRVKALLDEDMQDPSTLCFFSFYELTEIFQLRSLFRRYTENLPPDKQEPPGTGALLMGHDCLRVARLDEAAEWFEKAATENPTDYRPHIAAGLLSLERSMPQKALACFRKALSLARDQDTTCYIRLLVARLYETLDAVYEAKEQAEKVLQAKPAWLDAQYHFAVIQVKLGQVKAALKFFTHLVEQSPRYYLMAALDPELHEIKKDIAGLLQGELQRMRAACQESYHNISETMETFKKWFPDEDADLRKASGLFRRASAVMQQESISGLYDMPDVGDKITRLFNHAVGQRRTAMRATLARFKKILDEQAVYLERYPYPNILSRNDRKHYEAFHSLFEHVHEAVVTFAPSSYREAYALMEQLSQSARELLSRRERLEVTKELLFALECSLKIVICFFITGAAAACVLTALITAYQIARYPSTALTATLFVQYLKYGCLAGFCSGTAATAVWFTKRFKSLRKKIEA